MQLFAERATASDNSFQLDDENAPLVVEVCRQLDGIPLAIELTAALVRVFSLRDVSAGLGDKLLALRSSRRMVVSRHQTLHAMLNWSHQLLPPFENGRAVPPLGVPRRHDDRRGPHGGQRRCDRPHRRA